MYFAHRFLGRAFPKGLSVRTQSDTWKTLSEQLLRPTDWPTEDFRSKESLSARLQLQSDLGSKSILRNLLAELHCYESSFSSMVHQSDTYPYWILEERYRTILQLLETGTSLLDRANPAHNQSMREWFFDQPRSAFGVPSGSVTNRSSFF
jgi:hypothetical protein